ncbi:MAG: hypothetical protein U1C56_01385 [Candidatus Curtissbacteria bacterium]|nr:hypothetical protein [Candidatus Curtissbacteria bacterium]
MAYQELQIESFRSYYESKRPFLEGRSIAELKELKENIRDKYWNLLLNKRPFLPRDGEAVSRLSFYDIAIAVEIEERRKGSGNHE